MVKKHIEQFNEDEEVEVILYGLKILGTSLLILLRRNLGVTGFAYIAEEIIDERWERV